MNNQLTHTISFEGAQFLPLYCAEDQKFFLSIRWANKDAAYCSGESVQELTDQLHAICTTRKERGKTLQLHPDQIAKQERILEILYGE